MTGNVKGKVGNVRVTVWQTNRRADEWKVSLVAGDIVEHYIVKAANEKDALAKAKKLVKR